MTQPVFHRVLLKLTGELLGGKEGKGIDFDAVDNVAKQVITLVKNIDIELAIVVGAGNLFRGRQTTGTNVDRAVGDYMGMLGTIMNALALQEAIERFGADTRMMTSLDIPSVAEPFIRRKAIHHLNRKRIVILGGGTGNPFFTTDSAAALRASELNCDVILKGSNVDGVYDKDPNKFPDAKLYRQVSYQEALEKNLQVMDNTAFALCQNKNIPIVVFNINTPDIIERILTGEEVGTIVK